MTNDKLRMTEEFLSLACIKNVLKNKLLIIDIIS